MPDTAAPALPELPEWAARTARELADLIATVSAEQPFGAEPANLLETLERLADGPEREA